MSNEITNESNFINNWEQHDYNIRWQKILTTTAYTVAKTTEPTLPQGQGSAVCKARAVGPTLGRLLPEVQSRVASTAAP